MQRGSIQAFVVNLTLALTLSSASFAADAQAIPPPPLERTISVNPSTTARDSRVAITVANAPVDATVITVYLDGLSLPAKATLTKDTYSFLVPGAQAGAPFIPLGKHQVAVAFDKSWFTGDATLTVVDPGQPAPVITDVQEQQFTRDSGRNSLTLTGNNFIETPAQDNQIVIGGVVVPVKWDGCPAPGDKSAGSASPPEVHGNVLSAGQIQLCYLRLPAKLPLDILVRQGETTSNIMQIYAMPLSPAKIVLFSLGVVVLAAALVIFLASFLRKYPVNRVKYGMFRILYLDPETNSYSLSKYQFYMWTATALFSYTYLALSRVFVQGGSMPDVPGSLPGIIGISAGTAVGAQVVTAVRGPKGGGSELPSLADFVTSGGVAAPERVQMFVWTNLGALLFCLVVLHDAPWHITNLPTLGDGLMYLMGVSSAGYLGGKLARKPGPIISEVSVYPDGGGIGAAATASPATGIPGSPSAATFGDFSQPVAAAQQASRETQNAIAAVPATSSAAAFAAAQSALKSLRDGIAAATAPGPNLLATLADGANAADAACQLAAAEVSRLLDAATGGPEDPQLANVRTLAEQAQRCASASQDLASGVSQAAGTVQAAASAEATSSAALPGQRTIELRGRNLSMDATFEINNEELPFRMLSSDGGVKAPKMVAPEDDPNQAKLARELRLVMDPAALGQADTTSYNKWFNSGNRSLLLAITNPDGQRSEISFDLPPGSQQARG